MMTAYDIDDEAERMWLEARRECMPQVDALLMADWKFELPGVHDEPWQWRWRRPPLRKGVKGRLYLSTRRAYQALIRSGNVKTAA